MSDEFHTYLVAGRRDYDDANLDWVVTASDARRAVELWRAYLVENEWLDAEDAAEQKVDSVARMPGTPLFEVVWPWEQLFCPEGEYQT